MRIEWDEAKNRANRKKHGIRFQAAQLVFDDPHHIAFVDAVVAGEERWHAIGVIDHVLLAVVVHTYRENGQEEVIRIISARRASRRERKLYEEALE